MDQDEMETLVRNIDARVTSIDARTTRIEQILPTLATKQDLNAFATKEDLKVFPTRDEMRTTIQEEGECTRQHFNAVAERIEASVKAIAEGHEVTRARVDAQRIETKTALAKHDRRIMKLAAESLKRR